MSGRVRRKEVYDLHRDGGSRYGIEIIWSGRRVQGVRSDAGVARERDGQFGRVGGGAVSVCFVGFGTALLLLVLLGGIAKCGTVEMSIVSL